MPMYRFGEPGDDTVAHVNFGRKPGPGMCIAPRLDGDNPKIGSRCFRISTALCDAPAGFALDGRPMTCDAPICDHHRARAGAKDYCPRHAHLAPAALPLEEA